MKTKTSHCLKNINQKPLKKRLFLCHKKQNTTYIILRRYIKTKKISKKLDKYMLCVYNTKCSHKYRGMEQLAARRAHNPKVVSSSLTPATKKHRNFNEFRCFYYVLKLFKTIQKWVISRVLLFKPISLFFVILCYFSLFTTQFASIFDFFINFGCKLCIQLDITWLQELFYSIFC